MYFKNIFINITTNLSNASKYWEAVTFPVADTCFPKILIFAGKLKFYHWQQILSVVFLEVTGSLGSFFKKCLPNAQAWIILVCLSVVLSDKKWCSMKKTKTKPASSACNSNTGAFCNNHCGLGCSWSALLVFLMSSCRILKSCVFKDWDLIKLVNFYCFIKDIVKGNWVFFFSFLSSFLFVRMWWRACSLWRMTLHWKSDDWCPLAPLLWFVLGCWHFTRPCFHTRIGNVNIAEKANNTIVLLLNSFWPCRTPQ